MNTIPDEVQAVILAERKRASDLEFERQKASDEKRQILIKQGTDAVSAFLLDVIGLLPEWATYYAKVNKVDEDELAIIGEYGVERRGTSAALDIPGLAPITLRRENRQGTYMLKYSVPGVGSGDVFDEITPGYSWGRSSSDLYDLERAVCLAYEAAQSLDKYQQEYSEKTVEREAQRSMREAMNAAQEARSLELSKDQQTREQREQDEAEKLLSALRNDHVAVHMMKAFLAISQERSMFEQRISDADDTMCSMEERWSQKAADLRREADAAERRAREERDRASDLENDLDDVKRKAKRGF